MSLRPRLLASTSFLISSLSMGAWAQTPSTMQPAPPDQAPAETAPAPEPAPAGQAPAAPTIAPTASPNGGTLPTIQVTAKHGKQRPVQRKPPGNAATTSLAASPPPPTPYQIGAPNVAGGTPAAPQLASQMTVSGQDLNARPITEPGELLEAAPGLAVIQHSGSGKANQFYLRGWNLDHGTDLATFWDDIPINLPTHAHGQGYTDLNFLIPETVSGLDIRKGPYFADVGDFENAGNLHILVRDTVEQNIQSLTVGSFGYDRFLSLGSTKVGGGNLLYAGEFNTYDGPWTTSEDVRKFNGLLRYSEGTATDGFSVTGMAYANSWNATDQVALRAITTGQIGLYGELDPSDGGASSRFSLSARMAQSTADGSWKANAYVMKYNLDLFSDFDWYTADPVNQDQFHQHDDRIYGGGGVSRTVNGTLFNLPTETTFGAQTRYDDINIGLSNTFYRQLLSNTLVDHVNEGNAAIYAQSTVHWTDWFKTTLGWRGDYFGASVDSMLQPANSGNTKEAIGSPKFTAAIGPFYKTELFFGAGMGYHSNDARGTVTTEVPGDPTTPQSSTPFLVRSRGGEVGVRTKAIPDLDSSVSVFYLHQDSELFFDGDDGTTTPGLPSQRTGIEFTNDYRPTSWVHIDAHLALSRARFLGFDSTQEALYELLAGYPQAQIGNAPGNFVYNAPWMIGSAGITLGEKTGWFGELRWRYISSRPLTEDGTFQAPPTNVINGGVGYRFENGWRVQLDALNLLDSTTYNAEYAYGALLTTDALFAMCYPAKGVPVVPAAVCANGVMDYSLHPIEPLAFRLTLAGPIETFDADKMATEFRRAIPAYQAPAANYDWTGFYVGAHAGSAWSRTGGSTINTATGDVSGPLYGSGPDWHGGIQVGYNYMMPNRVVLGVEADISSGGTKVTTLTEASGTSANQTTVFDSESVRGRLGYAWDNVLFYGTGGWAWSSEQFVRTQLTGALNLASAGTDEAVDKYLGGWTAGGGAAVAFAQNWSAFAEYRYTDYGSSTIALPFSLLTTTSTTKISEVDFGVNYKFNWGARAGAGSALVYKAPVVSFDRKPSPVYKAQLYKALVAPRAADWTGFYLGIDGGYGWGTSGGTLTDATGAPLAPYSYPVRGPLSGGFVGANYQFNQVVVGVEGDWQKSFLIGNNQVYAPLNAAGALPAGPFTISTTTKDYESIRGRLGFAFDRFLVYGTGGWAWGDPAVSYGLVGSAPFVSNTAISSGWTAGAGLEYAITDNVLGRVEYRYTDLKTSSFVDATANAADGANRVPISDTRVGLAYKFGIGPLFGKY